MNRQQERTVWSCVYCRWLIEVKDPVDVIDHLLDEHREQLIADKPSFPLIGQRKT
jgi:Zn-finger protein